MENNTVSEVDTKSKYSSIMSCMSHEIRTQMNSITSLAFLLKDNSLNESKKNELVNNIHTTCNQLITVFENFTELEYGTNENIEDEEEKCYVHDLLAPLFDEFRSYLIIDEKQEIELINEIQNTNLDEVIINKNNVYKIFRCLFLNSLYNTEFGYIRIGLYEKNNKHLTFYISDSGNNYEKIKKLLDFKEINSSYKQLNDLYSAINIFLAKKFIQALHGVVEISHNGANGTKIDFTIPIKKVIKPKPSFYRYFKQYYKGA